MKKCFRIDSFRESEVLSEYIESQFIKSDSRKRKQSMQAKQIKHANAILSKTIVKTKGKSQAEKVAALLRSAGWTNVTVRETHQFSRSGKDDIYGSYATVWVASGFNPGGEDTTDERTDY